MEDSELHLSAVTIGEIQAGIELTRAQDPGRAQELEAWADQLAGPHALVHNLAVVTRNVRDLTRFDVPVLNPFK